MLLANLIERTKIMIKITAIEARNITLDNENEYLEPLRNEIEQTILENANKGLSECHVQLQIDPTDPEMFIIQNNNLNEITNELKCKKFEVHAIEENKVRKDTDPIKVNIFIGW